jgi:hypothetical protein
MSFEMFVSYHNITQHQRPEDLKVNLHTAMKTSDLSLIYSLFLLNLKQTSNRFLWLGNLIKQDM